MCIYQRLCSKEELYSVGTEGSVQFLRSCSLHDAIKSQSLSSSLRSVTVPIFFFPKVHFINVYVSASLPALLWSCSNKHEAPVLQAALHWMFFLLRNWKEERCSFTVQSQVLHVNKYEANFTKNEKFWFSTRGSHRVSFRVINGRELGLSRWCSRPTCTCVTFNEKPSTPWCAGRAVRILCHFCPCCTFLTLSCTCTLLPVTNYQSAALPKIIFIWFDLRPAWLSSRLCSGRLHSNAGEPFVYIIVAQSAKYLQTRLFLGCTWLTSVLLSLWQIRTVTQKLKQFRPSLNVLEQYALITKSAVEQLYENSCMRTAVQWPPLNVYTGARCKQNTQTVMLQLASAGPAAAATGSLLTYLLSNIHHVQDGLNTVLFTVSISILGFISLLLFTFCSSRRARSASGVLLKLIVLYQTFS